MKKVQTWLPIFSGFYNTIWEPKIERINEQRKEKGFEPITHDDCNWDNSEYEDRIARAVTNHIGNTLVVNGFISSYKFEELRSPREYNFKNDSINVTFVPYKRMINAYLTDHTDEFAKHLAATYTSRSGFISSYPNTVAEFMQDNPLDDKHKLGAILNFILRNEEVSEIYIYEDVTCNTEGITATNYSALIDGSEPVEDEKD